MDEIKFPVYSTIFHADWEGIFETKYPWQCKSLLEDIFAFMRDGTEPVYNDDYMQRAWDILSRRLKYDIMRYQQKVNDSK